MKVLKPLFLSLVCILVPAIAQAQYFNMPGTYGYALNSVRQVMGLSPDGKLGVTLTDRIIVFDPLTGAQLDTKPSGFGPLGIYLVQTSLGLRVAVLTSAGGPRRVAVFDLSQAGKLTQLGESQLTTSNADAGSGVVLSGSGQVGFVNVVSSSDSTMNDLVAFSLVDGSIIKKTTMLANGDMGISEAGGKRTLGIFKNSTASLQWFDVTDPAAAPTLLGDVPLTLNFSNNGTPMRSIVFSGDGRYIFVAHPGVIFSVIDTTTKQVISSIGNNLSFFRLRQFEDGQRRLIVLEATPIGSSGTPVIMLVDATDPAQLVTVNQTGFPLNFTPKGDLAFSKDASRLYLLTRDGLIALSLPSFATIWRQTGPVNQEQQLIVYGPADDLLGAWANLNGTPNQSVIGALPANPPSITISDTSVTEGDTASVNADFTVNLSAPSTHRVGVSYATGATGTAQSGVDFTGKNGSITFEPGETTKTISVQVTGDLTDEFDEAFILFLSNPTAALLSTTQATATIIDNDPPPTVTIGDVVILEGHSGTRGLMFTATLDRVSGKPVSFEYSTVNGTASSGTDYNLTSGVQTFAGGGTQRTIEVTIFGDPHVEADETFSLALANPQNVTLARSAAVATIIGDDSATGNPLDLSGFFVRQQYLDFLGREPDASGFNFWTANINQCGGDLGCAEVQRINVSAAFFLSIEFKETGYFVERLYKSAYGDASGNSTFQSPHQLPVPIIRLNEFFLDAAFVGAGVVVLQPGWEQLLESRKAGFASSFVVRARFVNDYPTSMPAAEFVDKLNLRAGNPLPPAERNQLVIDLATNAKTRGEVLRAIADHPTVVSAEFNRAFVLMQYLGYLKRNPDGAPDNDYTGYDFWLTKLNEFSGNYIDAEMVKAFITSTEYRKRFGP